MNVESNQASAKGSRPGAWSNPASDQKELAWAFVSLILWSAVVLGGIFGVSFVPGSVALVMIVVPALPGPWTKRAEINIGNDI
jgi:hypothetical protein